MAIKTKQVLAILHFQPLEKFPPVMNLAGYLAEEDIGARIFSTGTNRNGWRYRNTYHFIYRYGGKMLAAPTTRFISYAIFNIFTILHLILSRPRYVFYYDTLSVWPAYVYKLLNPHAVLMVHHHEYMTTTEYRGSSPYLKWLYRVEQKALPLAGWISQTNRQRLEFFWQDNNQLSIEVLHTLPNYPPLNWFKGAGSKPIKARKPLSFVYVGSLGLKDTYIIEFVNWICKLDGAATLDIYSAEIPADTQLFLDSMRCRYISLRGAVSYYDLPNRLLSFDVGLVLYKGSNFNMKYNVPNKVMEYYACGLEVWCSSKIVSTYKFKEEEGIEQIRMIDFDKLNEIMLPEKKEHGEGNRKKLCCEISYRQVVDFIQQHSSRGGESRKPKL